MTLKNYEKNDIEEQENTTNLTIIIEILKIIPLYNISRLLIKVRYGQDVLPLYNISRLLIKVHYGQDVETLNRSKA